MALKKILRQFCLPPKKSLGERIQNQLRDCKYPDKKLRYPRLQLFSHFLCTAKYENVASQRLLTLNTPVPIRSPKLSSVEPSQYLDG